MTLRRICVFCGSSPGGKPEYAEAARRLGLALVERGMELVYGGGRVGLMGQIARTMLDAGAKVIGVIPRQLVERELAFTQATELRVVESMHERKAQMAELADGFIALPGGLGTIEELFEVLTWAQLGIHSRPCGLVNVAGYFDPLLAFVDRAVAERFVDPAHRALLLVDSDPARLVDRLGSYEPTTLDKAQWLQGLRAT